MTNYKLQADTINGIYEVKEFDNDVNPMELDDFIYECGDDFDGTIAVEVCELELKGLDQDYGVTRL